MSLIKPPCVVAGCYKPIIAGNKCLDHQPKAFANNYRKDRLPANWKQYREQVFALYGHICHLCLGDGADTIDHVIPGDDHNLDNLRPVHDRNYPHCHRYKTALEGVNSRRKPTEYGTFWKNKLNEGKKED